MIRQGTIKINFTIMLLLFITNHSYSQEVLTFENVETKSYELYKNQKWNELIRLGKLAIEDRIDFYSLRIRLGTAYYKTKNYLLAIPNFEKALEIGYDDELIYEFLYYSYLFTGRTEDKNFVFSKLSGSKKKYLRPLYNSFIDNIFAESGKGLSKNDQYDEMNLFPANSYSEQVTSGDYFYFNAGIGQLPFDRLNVTYSYSYLDLKKKQEIYINNYSLRTNYNNEYSQNQNRFYNSIDILAGTGLLISPAAHYINTKENRLILNSEALLNDSLKNFIFSKKEVNTNNFILSLAVSKYISIFKLGINGSFSYLNEKHQSQYGLSLTSFPFGGPRFFTSTGATLHYQDKIANLLFAQLLGLTVIKNLNFQATVTIGKIKNFNEQNGRVVFKDADLVKFKFGASFIYNFSNNLAAQLTFVHQQRERNFSTYYSFEEINNALSFQTDTKKIDYNVNAFLAGLKFYF